MIYSLRNSSIIDSEQNLNFMPQANTSKIFELRAVDLKAFVALIPRASIPYC